MFLVRLLDEMLESVDRLLHLVKLSTRRITLALLMVLALVPLRLAEVDAERRGVAEDVAADGLGRVAEVGVGVRRDLVGDEDARVEQVADAHQVVEVLVELLLAFGEFAAADVLGAEVSGERVHTEETDRPLGVLVLAGELFGLLGEENLVVGVENLFGAVSTGVSCGRDRFCPWLLLDIRMKFSWTFTSISPSS